MSTPPAQRVVVISEAELRALIAEAVRDALATKQRTAGATTAEQAWLTTNEAAKYCRMTKAALLQHVARGALRPDSRARPGLKMHRFKRATLDAFLVASNELER